jgi:hypothetical protein
LETLSFPTSALASIGASTGLLIISTLFTALDRNMITNYPAYFPQSASNPQSPHCYPDEALAEFRDWFRKEYINKKMPTYLLGKVKDGQITAPAATAAIEAFTPKQIMPPQIRPQRF